MTIKEPEKLNKNIHLILVYVLRFVPSGQFMRNFNGQHHLEFWRAYLNFSDYEKHADLIFAALN